MKKIINIQKRDGAVVPFDGKHIIRAILRAMERVSEGGEKDAINVTKKVTEALLLLNRDKKIRILFHT